ncbi:MAG: hypothetical protein J6D61_05675 [Clostridia bacterium]|nr:hypothetical protein [Clostridia bacterium]
MAKLECTLRGSKNTILRMIDHQLMEGSFSASYEDGSDFSLGAVECAVRVYERYSIAGGNRVSLNITLFGKDTVWKLSAVASGGSRAALFKMNTFGEKSFLQELENAVKQFRE